MGNESKTGGGGFLISVVLILVLFATFLLPDLGQEFSFSIPRFPYLGMGNIKSAIATPLLRLSFTYIGANEYIGSAIQGQGSSVLENDILTLLVLGVAGEGHISPYLTDSILVMRLDLSRGKAVAVSLPRDLLVQIPGSKNYTKINALYRIGLDHNEPDAPNFIKNKVEDIVGFSLARIIILDLASFEQVVDALGGVTIYIEKDISDTRFPTKEGGYTTFRVEQGWQHLDGETAARYIRTRHTPKGDIERIGRQQQMAYAIRNKISGLHPLFDLKTIFNVLESFRGGLKTSLTPEEITYLWTRQRDFLEEDLVFRSIDAFEKDSLLVSSSQTLGGERASVLIPRTGVENYEEIHEFIQNLIATGNQ